ncbi:hypothetical protein DESC_290142 [Desulfosarcina cetonica]|nr:hypothetical protein DESC_290142 [Desulfosarcina cetonica]
MGHAPGAEVVGRDDLVGAGRLDGPFGRILDGASHDKKIGIELFGDQRQENVVRIGGHGRDQSLGLFDAGLEEKILIGGLANQIQHAVFIHGRLPLDPFFDKDHVKVSLGQVAGQRPPDTPVATDDIMSLQHGDLFVQFTPPEDDSDPVFDQELDNTAAHIHEIAHAHQNEHTGEDPTRGADLVNLAIPDRGQGDQGHIHGVTEVPAFDQHIAGRSDPEKEEG